MKMLASPKGFVVIPSHGRRAKRKRQNKGELVFYKEPTPTIMALIDR
jgi:hypothetical protein